MPLTGQWSPTTGKSAWLVAVNGDTPFAPEPEIGFVERGAGIPLLLMHGSVSDYSVWARTWAIH